MAQNEEEAPSWLSDSPAPAPAAAPAPASAAAANTTSNAPATQSGAETMTGTICIAATNKSSFHLH